MKNECNEIEDKLSFRDIYDELWKGRDFELSHLWQRSIFVMSLLIVLIPSFFTVLEIANTGDNIFTVAKEDFYTITKNTKVNEPVALYGSLLVFISICIEVVSLYYIAIAKGSKYWYESYENSICALYNNYSEDLLSPELNRINRIEECKHLLFLKPSHYGIPRHGNLNSPDTGNSVFSMRAGDFSVSRINTALGVVTLFISLVFSIVSEYFILSNEVHFIGFVICLIHVLFYVIALLFIPYSVLAHYQSKHFFKSRIEFSLQGNKISDSVDTPFARYNFSKSYIAPYMNNELSRQVIESIGDKRLNKDSWLSKGVLSRIYTHYSYRGLFGEYVSSNLISICREMDINGKSDKNQIVDNLIKLFSSIAFIDEGKTLIEYLNSLTGNNFKDYFKNQLKGSYDESCCCRFFFDIPWTNLIMGKGDYDFCDYKLEGKCVWSYEKDCEIKYGLFEIIYDDMNSCYFTRSYKDGYLVEIGKCINK